jgi:AcrR family transcriptional regulator
MLLTETSEVTMAASPRRVGAETSKTRDTLLDCVEKMMLEEGYASVSYRALAAKAGVTASLVQYYFPSLDEIFLAAIRRYSDRNLELLHTALQKRAQDPLHAMWEYSWDEATGALITEFMAMGNHRKSIRSEIAEVTERMRKLQVDVLTQRFGSDARLDGELSLAAAVLLITAIPKFLNLEEGVGVDTAHTEVVQAVERYLDSIEPGVTPRKRKSSKASSRARR